MPCRLRMTQKAPRRPRRSEGMASHSQQQRCRSMRQRLTGCGVNRVISCRFEICGSALAAMHGREAVGADAGAVGGHTDARWLCH